jgi:predicted nucleic acid-binding protein
VIALDTSFLVAAFNQSDVLHRQASSAWDGLIAGQWGKGVLLEHVFVETISVLKRKTAAIHAIQTGAELLRSRELEFVAASSAFFDFWRDFQTDFRSPLSFVDLAVARIARERAGGKVLTFDRAFREIPGIKVEPA